jgi:hypothetical protein
MPERAAKTISSLQHFRHTAHLRRECHNSKSVIFQDKLLKGLKCYNFLWVQRRHNCSPAASFANCVMILRLLEVHLQTFLSIPIHKKCHILICDTLVANELYSARIHYSFINKFNYKHKYKQTLKFRHRQKKTCPWSSCLTNQTFMLPFGWIPGVWILYARKNSSCILCLEDGRECSETSVYKIQKPRNPPNE